VGVTQADGRIMVKSNEDRNLFMGHKSDEDEHELSQINQS